MARGLLNYVIELHPILQELKISETDRTDSRKIRDPQ